MFLHEPVCAAFMKIGEVVAVEGKEVTQGLFRLTPPARGRQAHSLTCPPRFGTSDTASCHRLAFSK